MSETLIYVFFNFGLRLLFPHLDTWSSAKSISFWYSYDWISFPWLQLWRMQCTATNLAQNLTNMVNNKGFFCSTYLITERQWNTRRQTRQRHNNSGIRRHNVATFLPLRLLQKMSSDRKLEITDSTLTNAISVVIAFTVYT